MEYQFRAYDRLKKQMSVSMNLSMLAGYTAGALSIGEDLSQYEWMQWIGRIDKHGKMIHVGDFIKGRMQNEYGSYVEGIREVIYCHHACAFELGPKMPHNGIGVDIEVVGNIWENPEMKI